VTKRSRRRLEVQWSTMSRRRLIVARAAASDEEEARALGAEVVALDDHRGLLDAHVSVPPARISRGAPLMLMGVLPSTIASFKWLTLSATRSVFPLCRMVTPSCRVGVVAYSTCSSVSVGPGTNCLRSMLTFIPENRKIVKTLPTTRFQCNEILVTFRGES
jgi:hypothetical protein